MITIYQRSDDAQGRATKAWLDERSIPYRTIDTTQVPGMNQDLQRLGFFTAHVVEVQTLDGVSRFEDFKPALLEALCGAVAV